jgi:NADP-dependent 3-hydroxy acid dehydrogenase YdfG
VNAASFAAIAPDRLAVVTGAASGIGLAAARAFAEAGMRVMLVDRPGEALDDAVASIDSATALPADVADRAAMHALARTVAERHGPVSILMNNAGIGVGGDAFADPAAWDAVLGVNLFGVLNGVQAFVPAMIDSDALALVINTAPSRASRNRPATPPTTSARRA